MTNKIIDTLIQLNHQGKSLQEIATKMNLSWQQVWRLIHKDSRYIPGKRGFARLSKEEGWKVSSRGGKRAHELGVAHRWNKKSAKEASDIRLGRHS